MSILNNHNNLAITTTKGLMGAVVGGSMDYLRTLAANGGRDKTWIHALDDWGCRSTDGLMMLIFIEPMPLKLLNDEDGELPVCRKSLAEPAV